MQDSRNTKPQKGTDKPPRNPREIRPTTHFVDRFKRRRNPSITSEVVETCIKHGEVTPGRGSTLLYENDVRGVRWRLVVGFGAGDPVAITAYAPGVHGDREVSV